jgi:hypothetical protein
VSQALIPARRAGQPFDQLLRARGGHSAVSQAPRTLRLMNGRMMNKGTAEQLVADRIGVLARRG